jgi:hypothetical protein
MMTSLSAIVRREATHNCRKPTLELSYRVTCAVVLRSCSSGVTLSVIKADIGSIGGHGKLTEPVDAFAQAFWNTVRDDVAKKAMEMRRQGFVGTEMLPMSELEYTGISEKLDELSKRFAVRTESPSSKPLVAV